MKLSTKIGFLLSFIITFAAVIFAGALGLTYILEPEILPDTDGIEVGNQSVTIKLSADININVSGDTSKVVRRGEDAVFNISFKNDYIFASADEGVEYSDGVITIRNCTKSKSYSVSSKYKYDFYDFSFANADPDYGVVYTNTFSGLVSENKLITLTAVPTEGNRFLGWSIGASITDGGQVVSYASEYSFKLKGDAKYYPNFLQEGYAIIKYNLNGGKLADGVSETLITQFDTSTKRCPNLLAETGIMHRDGYTLLEYTTNPDGTGTAINPGGLAVLNDAGYLEVWAQWAEWTDAENFTYIIDSGKVTITGYTANADKLVIPGKIDGKPVTKIAAGAVKNKSFSSLILPKSIDEMDIMAFENCQYFNTLYVYDTFNYIPDEAFYNCRKFSNMRLNAGRLPVHIVNSENMATRMSYVMTRDENKPLILIVGGSSVLYGVKAKQMDTALNNKYTVINCGTNANNIGMLFMESLSTFMKEGDIIINAPEYGNTQLGSHDMFWRMLRATECCYNMYRYVDFSVYNKFFSAMSEFNLTIRKTDAGRSYDTKNTALTEGYCDLPNSGNTGVNSGNQTINASTPFDENRINNLNRIHSLLSAKGIKYYFSCAPIFGPGLTASSNLTAYYEKACLRLSAPVISDPNDYVFEAEHFSNSIAHLTEEGAQLRTQQLLDDLEAQFEKEALTP